MNWVAVAIFAVFGTAFAALYFLPYGPSNPEEVVPNSSSAETTALGQGSQSGTASIDDISSPMPEAANQQVAMMANENRGSDSRQPPPGSMELRPRHYRRLPNGSRISDDVGYGGLGKLTVQNGTGRDAVVRLLREATDETVRWFYVRSKATVTVDEINPGTYDLMYTTGFDWDDSVAEFRVEANYSEFERQLRYFEADDGNATQYKTVSVTLQPVPDGNVRTRSISRQEFLKGHVNQVVSR